MAKKKQPKKISEHIKDVLKKAKESIKQEDAIENNQEVVDNNEPLLIVTLERKG